MTEVEQGSQPAATACEVTSEAQLEEYFERGCRPRSDRKIGVEYETPIVDAASGEAVAYDGPRGVSAVLSALCTLTGWDPVAEDGNLIALRGTDASITLEPGGQLEMSGEQCESLHCADRELRKHVGALSHVGTELGLRFLGLAATPKTPLSRMPWMPKERYRIMRRVMESTGRLGHRMMQQTATVQANFDYESEPDARRKFRVAMAMPPILVATSANSPILDGEPTGYKSYRAHVWTDTDPARCGILPFAFDTDGLFGAYTRYALDVPLYFLVRGGRLLPAEGRTFRDLLHGRVPGQTATMDDWAMHLTTLFPEARLKTYIEVRSADCQPIESMLAPPALMKGLLYDDDCLEGAWDVLRRWKHRDILELWGRAAREGLSARAGRHGLREHARDLVEIASEGLRRQAAADDAGRDERIFLDPLAAAVESGITPADAIIAGWNGIWNQDIDAVIAHAGVPRPSTC